MKYFQKGTYLGQTETHLKTEGIRISETTYPEGLCSDWHYHENPYFAMILSGGSQEERRRGSFHCYPSQLIHYDFDEQHRNFNYQPDSRNINVEFDREWLAKLGFQMRASAVEKEFVRVAFLKILNECGGNDPLSEASLQLLALEFLRDTVEPYDQKNPAWVNKIREVLWDQWDKTPSLNQLASQLNLHPVTISRYFARYFNCSLSDYMRRIKTEKALELLKRTNMNLFEIALICGFSDSSHFNRVFKSYTGFLPGQFRRL